MVNNQGTEHANFTGESTLWHGFKRYDFLIDEKTLAIQQIKAAKNEACESNNETNSFNPVEGQRRCVVVVPNAPAPGKPWSWRGCYFGHEAQSEIALLKQGFHIGFIISDPDATWDTWYAFLTEQHGLSPKPAFLGMSRGGINAYIWATANPDKVSCIYADNPVIRPECLMKLGQLVEYNVPLLNICGSLDPFLGDHTLTIEALYRQLGGKISVMIQEGLAHHPHSLRDPQPIVDFITQNTNPQDEQSVPAFVGEQTAPAFLGKLITKFHFYTDASTYRYAPSEKTWITYRGPQFNPSYRRYNFRFEGTRLSVITPLTPASGMPWVYRTDFVARDATVDFALLAEGYHIVTGPVPTSVDGPVVEEWNAVYRYLISHGFSSKPVMAGCGAAAGEAYAWAIANPDKVACIYAENPVLHSNLATIQPIDNLAPLADAGVPILHVCGSADPWLDDNTRVVEKRYQTLGGAITVIVKDGLGHYPLTPEDPAPVVDFITKNVS